jgi:predicted DNA-binding protein (MmcQ/YjbR family)
MNIEELRDFCLSFYQTEECLPFDETTLVFKVYDKMFCLTDLNIFESINIKCEPEKAITLRELYQDVTPGFHMNKKHWNTVKTNKNLSDKLIKEWISDSYWLVVNSLPKNEKQNIKQFYKK